MDFNEDSPLGNAFYQNPHDYFQNYVRNMNNELFLSEYQINNLYALLLIGRASPWDALKPNTPTFKQEVDVLIEKKIKDVKFLLDKLSQMYEEKVKKATFNQIEKLMGIIKARNKSIFIQKYYQPHCPHHQEPEQIEIESAQHQNQDKKYQQGQPLMAEGTQQQNIMSQETQQAEENIGEERDANQHKIINSPEDEKEVFGIFAGLANLPNLSTLALSNCLEYNASERFIKFKMSKNYVMTIKNDDPVSYDMTSSLRKVPSSLFISHVFPYLTATELFRARSVCKEWLSHVKDSWHSTFKREMYIQLLAGEFCKDIQFFYKCIQLRNPFFHKLSLLLHALIEIIQWQSVNQSITDNTINVPLKRVLLVLLKFLGENVEFSTVNHLNDEQLWLQHKDKVFGLKERVTQFFTNLSGTGMSIQELRVLKTQILDHPFMRGDQMQTQEKTPLLLLIFVKQLNLQQILKNHLYFSQEYLMNSKSRLDDISMKMPQQKGFLEGVYKVLLLKAVSPKEEDEMVEDKNQMPNFQTMIQSIFENKESDQPDFSIRTKTSKTSIYMDRATKLDIIISTVRKIQGPEGKDLNEAPPESESSETGPDESAGQNQQKQNKQSGGQQDKK